MSTQRAAGSGRWSPNSRRADGRSVARCDGLLPRHRPKGRPARARPRPNGAGGSDRRAGSPQALEVVVRAGRAGSRVPSARQPRARVRGSRARRSRAAVCSRSAEQQARSRSTARRAGRGDRAMVGDGRLRRTGRRPRCGSAGTAPYAPLRREGERRAAPARAARRWGGQFARALRQHGPARRERLRWNTYMVFQNRVVSRSTATQPPDSLAWRSRRSRLGPPSSRARRRHLELVRAAQRGPARLRLPGPPKCRPTDSHPRRAVTRGTGCASSSTRSLRPRAQSSTRPAASISACTRRWATRLLGARSNTKWGGADSYYSYMAILFEAERPLRQAGASPMG